MIRALARNSARILVCAGLKRINSSRSRQSRRRPVFLGLDRLEDRTVPTAVAPGGDWNDNYNNPTVFLHNGGPGWLEVTGGGGSATVSPGAPPASSGGPGGPPN